MAGIFNLFRKKKMEGKEEEPEASDSKSDKVPGSEKNDYIDISAKGSGPGDGSENDEESSRGKLIVIEGNDGSGKRTQIDLLADRLGKKLEIEVLDFPDYGSFYGKLIKRYLSGEFGKQVNPYLIAMAYANDRLTKREKMMKWLNAGKTVICNRYVASNKAHQAVKLGTAAEMQDFVKWVDEMEYEVNALPRPDITIYLYVPVDIAIGLVQQRADKTQTKTDIHEKLSYMKKVEQIYLAMSKNKNWIRIDCVEGEEILTKDEIHGKVYNIVKNQLI
ncbi:MAG: dTMP kinase [archaeon GW2011_AR3]|nr:MAG: dTMP kinase [archaeon GW2011_AR3]MBS3109005.1 dTMP kinase [Candidatus Woesearchaeota archaeon]